MSFPLWPHQEYGINECLARLDAETPQKVVVSSNTGAGKSKMMTEIIINTGARVALYTHRKMLLAQTAGVLEAAGIDYGVRASGYEENREHRVQLCSTQTIEARVLRSGRQCVHQCDLVLIDESHVQKAATMVSILERHAGAHVIGFTATPVEIGHIYDHIIQAGSTSSLRACGALLPAHHYGCEEVDTSKIQPGRNGDFSYGDIKKAWHPPVIFGKVFDNFLRINPDRKPSILFAPGVPESMYLAEQFWKNGVPAAHISAETIWINGDVYEPTQENRDMLAAMAESGDVTVTCNRFVMREGIDWPFLAHLIFATPFGSICSYLQAGGRVLRNHPDLEFVTIQDQGGCWWRHGSLNADREWRLDDTANIIRGERMQNIRDKKEPEPITCYKCFRIRLSGPKCPYCGVMAQDRRRAVIQTNGTLKRMTVGAFKPRRVDNRPGIEKRWNNQYHRAKMSRNKMNFNQAMAMYAMDNGWRWPPRTLPKMPVSPRDWYKPVCEVPVGRLQ